MRMPCPHMKNTTSSSLSWTCEHLLTHSLHCGRRDGVPEGGAEAEDAGHECVNNMLTHSLHRGRRDGVPEGGAEAEDAGLGAVPGPARDAARLCRHGRLHGQRCLDGCLLRAPGQVPPDHALQRGLEKVQGCLTLLILLHAHVLRDSADLLHCSAGLVSVESGEPGLQPTLDAWPYPCPSSWWAQLASSLQRYCLALPGPLPVLRA